MRAIPVRATSKLGRIIYKAVLACGKGRVLVIDCKAIGGSGGWKKSRRGWAAEKIRAVRESISPPPEERTSELGRSIANRTLERYGCHSRRGS